MGERIFVEEALGAFTNSVLVFLRLEFLISTDSSAADFSTDAIPKVDEAV
ncbi:MAG: hypothetical protein IPN15_06750 [Saprospiraceae bacterium]|nr:hypothetical protein [Candidatus Vicinibacter affinis]